jgi:hypothetical protein
VANSNSPPPSESTGNSQTAIAKYTGKWHTNSSSFYVPTDDNGGQLRIGKNIHIFVIRFKCFNNS